MKLKQLMVSMALAACALSAARAEDMAPAMDAQPSTVTAQRIADIEAELADLQARYSAAPASSSFSDKIKINGFMSAGVGYADVEDLTYDNDLSDVANYKAGAVVGLQFEAQVNEQVNAMVQLVARGHSDFKAEAEWAYVGYRPTQHDEFRIGRMRSAFYMLSEYLEVGYTYPWVRPPAEHYQVAFPSAIEGLSWLHRIDAGGWQHDIQVTWGNTKSSADAANQLDVDDGGSYAWVVNKGNWQFKAHYATANLTALNELFAAFAAIHNNPDLDPTAGVLPGSQYVPIDTTADRVDIAYTTAALQYDNGSLLVMVEASQAKIEGFFDDSESAYALVGYRFGKVMPHLTWAKMRSSDKDKRPDVALGVQDDLLGNADGLPDLCPLVNPTVNALCMAQIPWIMVPADQQAVIALLNGGPAATVGVAFPTDALSRILGLEQESVTLGVRYDFLPNAALKVDWTRVIDTNDTFGLFSNEFARLMGAPPDDDVDVFRLAVDVVF